MCRTSPLGCGKFPRETPGRGGGPGHLGLSRLAAHLPGVAARALLRGPDICRGTGAPQATHLLSGELFTHHEGFQSIPSPVQAARHLPVFLLVPQGQYPSPRGIAAVAYCDELRDIFCYSKEVW